MGLGFVRESQSSAFDNPSNTSNEEPKLVQEVVHQAESDSGTEESGPQVITGIVEESDLKEEDDHSDYRQRDIIENNSTSHV